MTCLAVILLLVAALPLGAQERGRDSTDIPPNHRPPPGMCRIWIDGVPAGRQPAPTDCATAIRRRPPNARVIFGDELRKAPPVRELRSKRPPERERRSVPDSSPAPPFSPPAELSRADVPLSHPRRIDATAPDRPDDRRATVERPPLTREERPPLTRERPHRADPRAKGRRPPL